MVRFLALSMVVAGMLAAVPGTTRADEIFDFSFTNSTGNTAGTVTGTIDFAITGDATNVAASDVTITSYPSAWGNIGTTPVDVFGMPISNSFTVSGGEITAADFFSKFAYMPDGGGLMLKTTSGELYDSTTGNYVEGDITYTPQVSTPEPAALTLLGTGLLALGGFGLRRWRRKPSAS
jgi:PEP-CTERM motif